MIEEKAIGHKAKEESARYSVKEEAKMPGQRQKKFPVVKSSTLRQIRQATTNLNLQTKSNKMGS